MFCSNCGTSQPDGRPFCSGCGKRLISPAASAPEPAAPAAPQSPAKKQRRWPLVALVLALVLALGVAGCCFLLPQTGAEDFDYVSLADDFAGAVLLADGEEIEALAHEAMAEDLVDLFCASEYRFSGLSYKVRKEASLEDADAWQALLTQEYDMDVTLEAGHCVTFTGKLNYQGDSYSFTLAVYVARLDGRWYPIGAEMVKLEDGLVP